MFSPLYYCGASDSSCSLEISLAQVAHLTCRRMGIAASSQACCSFVRSFVRARTHDDSRSIADGTRRQSVLPAADSWAA